MDNEQFKTHTTVIPDKIISSVGKTISGLLSSNLTVPMFASALKKNNRAKQGFINFFKYPKLHKYRSTSFSKLFSFDVRNKIVSKPGKNTPQLLLSKLDNTGLSLSVNDNKLKKNVMGFFKDQRVAIDSSPLLPVSLKD